MFKQVFTRLFRTGDTPSQNRQAQTSAQLNGYVRRPIYNPIPTISSCFQQQSSNAMPSLANYYDPTTPNDTDANTNNSEATNLKAHTSQTSSSRASSFLSSISSISPRSSSSSEASSNSSSSSTNKASSKQAWVMQQN